MISGFLFFSEINCLDLVYADFTAWIIILSWAFFAKRKKSLILYKIIKYEVEATAV